MTGVRNCMKQLLTKSYLGIVISLLVACNANKSVSIIVSDVYDSKNDITTFSKLPFGSCKLPGKWTKSSYNETSKQYFFKNKDTVSVAISINRNRQYPFYKENLKNNEFINLFYEWDSKFLADKNDGVRTIVNVDTLDSSILWRLSYSNEVNYYFIYGTENDKALTINVVTNKWSDSEKEDFLKKVYKSKEITNCCK